MISRVENKPSSYLLPRSLPPHVVYHLVKLFLDAPPRCLARPSISPFLSIYLSPPPNPNRPPRSLERTASGGAPSVCRRRATRSECASSFLILFGGRKEGGRGRPEAPKAAGSASQPLLANKGLLLYLWVCHDCWKFKHELGPRTSYKCSSKTLLPIERARIRSFGLASGVVKMGTKRGQSNYSASSIIITRTCPSKCSQKS